MKNFYNFRKLSPLLILAMFWCISTNAQENRTYDGYGNNLTYESWGAKGTNVRLMTPVGFADLISAPAGPDRLNPRVISNMIFDQEGVIHDWMGLSDFAWLWGQFIDHDITFGPEDPNQPMSIKIPAGDPYFDPDSTGVVTIHTSRSVYDPNTGDGVYNPRRFPNEISAFIDGSAVYGSDQERAFQLRSFVGGKLRVSKGNFLPYNTYSGEYDAPVDPGAPEMAMNSPYITKWYVAGDVRANENILLTAMHTLFVREHNRVAEEVQAEHPDWNDEQVYQKARKIVGGIIQAIVYEEWLPTMGVELPPYQGYDPAVNPGIMNVFAMAAYRYGHTMINSNIMLMTNHGHLMPNGNLTLRQAFFNPPMLETCGGIVPIFNGAAAQVEQNFDTKIITDLRNFLFGPPGAGGLDLAALNINRGRERGLPDYNTVRIAFGLSYKSDFDEITSNPELANVLQEVYGTVDDIDPWVGFLSEDHMPNSLFGETVLTLMTRQFRNIRDGDRFYYENDSGLTSEEKSEIKKTRLSHVIRRNTDVMGIQDNVFVAQDHPHMEDFVIAGHPIQELSVFPNPGQEHFSLNVQVDESTDGELEVFNALGNRILHHNLHFYRGNQTIPFSIGREFPGGQYFVRLTIGERVEQLPLIKLD